MTNPMMNHPTNPPESTAVREGRSLFGPGWKAVDNFDDLSDIDEYESDEEELYVTLDLGAAVDTRTLLTETDYQLIGLDTPVPFFKLHNQIFRGDVATLLGDEVILGLRRNHENPHNPSHPPLYTTNRRIILHPVALQSLTQEDEPKLISGHAARRRVLGQPSMQGRTRWKGTRGRGVRRESRDTPVTVDDSEGGGEDHPNVPLDPSLRETDPMSMEYTSAGPSKRNPKRIGVEKVINDVDEFNALDINELPPKAKIFLSPGVDLSQIGNGLNEDQRILTRFEVEKIKAGVPLTGRGSRSLRKKKDDEDSAGLANEGEGQEEEEEADEGGDEEVSQGGSDAKRQPSEAQQRDQEVEPAEGADGSKTNQDPA
ncbi:hypothetical protein BD324DRAFT_650844 [Kockovaella imperatae]|uniref:Transcription factor TFIIIC triple barrel domain-containing protein n=1 Tax=Kockovaella imperatae TaxID=4999 RepID=A0A1Y1UGS7_9TREE|nr:hypothetical protein BD324DRAFT_650844 [Kockovaella imperatae]ORX37238.1 hypothetical protein BD324DRAFT_650844 [Kockovaella imperatae]